MRRLACLLLPLLAVAAAPAMARETVEASAPGKLSVTFYRDPSRGPDDAMDRDMPEGFAMISETRTVTLPPGESTIRFTGVAEGMVAVTAIVTGLPGGTIEKNRNADLLSPAALVDGTLGNRVTITRTNPATGKATSESAVIRTRADGGLVLQTQEGFEAVRCSGLPEKLTFDRVPAGLSAQPVFTLDTRDASGGTYTVTLTYLAWGFDWQAHYVASLGKVGRHGALGMRLMSWLTLLNDNGQSFPDAELLAVAGKLNVTSDYQRLSDPPAGRPLRLTCYPIGSTAAGSPVPRYEPYPPPPAPPPAPMMMADKIVVTGSRRAGFMEASPAAVMAQEEQLGDLKLYRVPEPVTVNAKGMKQVAFLDRPEVKGELLYLALCSPWDFSVEPKPMDMVLKTVNDKKHGLGAALPNGGITLFQASSAGGDELLLGENILRDYAEGQDIEIALGASPQARAQCELPGEAFHEGKARKWVPIEATLSNANNRSITVRLVLGSPEELEVKGLRKVKLKDGNLTAEVRIAKGEVRKIRWMVRSTHEE